MTSRRTLLQWIGHSDLRAMAASLATGKREELMAKLGGPRPKEGDLGPTKTLLTTQAFDEVCLLSNYRSDWNRWYLDWLATDAKLVPVELEKPTDYDAIFRIADAELAKMRRRKDWAETELCLHLSPGTPAMAAVWLLLGKTRYPATFYETYGGKSWITEVPFDLTIDVIPEIPKVAERLLDQINRQFAAEEPSYQHKSLSDAATAFVKRHDWPGNVRQLCNVLVQAAVLAEGTTVDRNDLVAALGELPADNRNLAAILNHSLGDDFNLEEYLNDIHRQYLRRAMEEARGVKAEAARRLGMKNYQTLDAQLKRLNVPWKLE